MPKCAECNDRGVIELLTSTVPCKCRKVDTGCAVDMNAVGLRYQEEACFGTINGCTLSQPIITPLRQEPVPGMLERSKEIVAAMPDDATFTMEVDCGGEVSQFTGLSKSAVDFVHACLTAGWTPERVRDHLNEMATARKMNDAQAIRDAEARALGGFTVDELDAAAEEIAAKVPGMGSYQDMQEMVCTQLVRLLVRSTIRKALEPGGVLNPSGPGFAKGGPVSGTVTGRLTGELGPTFMPRTTPEDRAFRKGIGFVPTNSQCGKAELYRRMYGGTPNLDIDYSQIELRMLAHLSRKQEDKRNERRDFGGFPFIPKAPPAPPGAG